MEPFDTPTEQAQVNIDLTPALLRDTGWRVNTGNAIINNCDTTVNMVADGGLVLAAPTCSHGTTCAARPTPQQERVYAVHGRLQDAGFGEWGILVGDGGKVLSCGKRK